MTIVTFVAQIALAALYLLPIPYIVETNITAVIDSGSPLGTKTIKTIALIVGICWPIVVLYAIIRTLLSFIGAE